MSVKLWVLKECVWLEVDNSEKFCIPVTYGHGTKKMWCHCVTESDNGYVMEHVDLRKVVLFAVQPL
jgi:hypothetical protein